MSTLSDYAVAGGGSASAVYSETVTGWHVLKVEGYSKFKGIGVGHRVKSSYFKVGGHSWCITFFPDGFNRETADWICVELYLNYFPSHHDVKTSFTLSLLDWAGEPVESYGKSAECTFTSLGKSSHAFCQFISKKDMESSFINDDSFQIRCDITVAQVIRTREILTESTSVTPPMTDLQCHLGDLLASKVGGDVTFEVNGERITAHQYVLGARSSVFMAQLFGPMKVKGKKNIRIMDMDARVFKIMLQFIYTDTLHMKEIETDERTVIAQHLFVAADRYSLQKLKQICEEILCSSVDIRTAATTLVLAEQHACQGLKDACFKFLKRPGNLKAVMESDGFQHLKSSCPSLVQTITTRI